MPYAFSRAGRQLAGPVAFELRGPSGEPWTMRPEADPVTFVRGDGLELCLVARPEPVWTDAKSRSALALDSGMSGLR